MSRKRHPDAEIEAALAYAEANERRVEKSSSKTHAWGKMYCPHSDSRCRGGEFCIASIWGTPRKPLNHARQLRRVVDKCTGGQAEAED